MGVKASGVPRPYFPPHPNRSPRLRRRRGASLTAPLPPPGGKAYKREIHFEKSPKHTPGVIAGTEEHEDGTETTRGRERAPETLLGDRSQFFHDTA